MVPASILFLFIILGAATCTSLLGDSCKGDGCHAIEDITDSDSANSFLQMSKRATQSHKTLNQTLKTVRAHRSGTITELSSVKPFDCNKYRTPVQVMQNLKEYKDGYIVAELDTEKGEYKEIWRVPYNKTDPEWMDINACGINPIDSKVYCAIFASGAFIIRLDEKTIEFVAKLPYWIFNSGAFGPSGNMYLSNAWGKIVVAPDLAAQPGYTDLKADKKKLLDLGKAPKTQPDGWFQTSDLVAVQYDFGGTAGEGEYVMSAYGPHLQVAKYDLEKSEFSNSWKLDVSPSRWDNVYGAGWNFNSRLYFASNRGSGVYEIPLDVIDLDSDEKIEMPKIIGNEASLNNDGFNCMQMGSPFITTIMPFDCTSNPGPIQLIKVDMDEANFSNWRLPAKEYVVAKANFSSGQNEPIYRVPSNLTDPAFVSLNAAGISPKDSIAYGTLKLEWWESADDPSPFYIVRFDSGKMEYLAKVQGDADAIAGSFDSNGSYFVAAHPHLWKFEGIDKWKGYANQTDKGVKKFSKSDALLELKDRKPIADMVMTMGTFDGGEEAEYIISINQHKELSMTNIYTNEHTLLETNQVLSSGDGGGNFGAAWNFQGNIYFSSNDGEGVWKVPMDKVDAVSKGKVTLEEVGLSITIHDNDGMNCMNAAPPDPELTRFQEKHKRGN